jgi:hypothetical protein
MLDDDDAGDQPRDIFGELVPVSPQGSLTTDLVTGLANVSMSVASAGGSNNGLPFIGISRQGLWQYGVDGVKVDPKSTVAMNIRSLQHGYIAWVDGKPHDVMVPANQALPPASSLPPVGGNWELAVAIEMVFVSGPDKGTAALYKNNSLGARKAIKQLIKEVTAQSQVDPARIHPIVRLETSSYDHKKFGEITDPVFTVVGFTDGRGDPSKAPVKSPSPAPEAASPQAETAGVRRRRVG